MQSDQFVSLSIVLVIYQFIYITYIDIQFQDWEKNSCLEYKYRYLPKHIFRNRKVQDAQDEAQARDDML